MVAEAIRGSMDRWDLSTRVQEPIHDLLSVQPGRPVELSGPPGYGLTRLGFRMLTAESQIAPVVGVDVRGWMSPKAAWETGVVQERLVLVRCADPKLWPRVTAALVEGIRAVYAEVPVGVRDADLRRLTALARARQMRLVLRPISDGGGLGRTGSWARATRDPEARVGGVGEGGIGDVAEDRGGGCGRGRCACGVRTGRWAVQTRRRMKRFW